MAPIREAQATNANQTEDRSEPTRQITEDKPSFSKTSPQEREDKETNTSRNNNTNYSSTIMDAQHNSKREISSHKNTQHTTAHTAQHKHTGPLGYDSSRHRRHPSRCPPAADVDARMQRFSLFSLSPLSPFLFVFVCVIGRPGGRGLRGLQISPTLCVLVCVCVYVVRACVCVSV